MKSIVIYGLLIFAAQLALSSVAVACDCQESPDCNILSEYSGIYKGKLVSIQRGMPRHTLNVEFVLEHAYKGELSEKLTLNFPDSECTSEWKTGERYLIFREDAAHQSLCNKTRQLSQSAQLLSILERPPAFRLDVRIIDIPAQVAKRAKALVNGKAVPIEMRNTAASTTGKTAWINFQPAGRRGSFSVVLKLPGRWDVRTLEPGNPDFKVSRLSAHETIVSYTAKYVPAGCDLRVLVMRKRE